MLSLRKNKGLIVMAILAILSVSLLAFKASAMPSQVYSEQTATATSSVNYVGNGTATSTFQFDNISTLVNKIPSMQTVDSISLYLQVAASSTATQYTIQPQYSNNNVDWYSQGSQGTASAAGSIAVSTSTVFTWTPGTTATTSMVFNLPVVPALHERMLVSASGAAGAYYAEVDLKQNPSNP